MFFIGRTLKPAAKELWTVGAPLKIKLHMWDKMAYVVGP
jgi:hypothetical protein